MSFDVLWEVDPPARPELDRLKRELDVIDGLADRVLVPENATGRTAVSSLTVAHLAQTRGVPAIACLNARDRNLLGFRRDLLTARVLGIPEVLLVRGDASDEVPPARLKVSQMLAECRSELGAGLRVGVTTRLGRLAPWKREADRLLAQVSWSLDGLRRWRERINFAGPVLPAVMAVPSIAMGVRLGTRVPELAVPESWLDAISRDPAAGFDLAAGLVHQIRDSGAFDGVHMVGGARFTTAAATLRRALRSDLVPAS